jgi:hypothetical protein
MKSSVNQSFVCNLKFVIFIIFLFSRIISDNRKILQRSAIIPSVIRLGDVRLGSSGIHRILVDANESRVEGETSCYSRFRSRVPRSEGSRSRESIRPARRQEEIGGVFAAPEKKAVRIARTWVVGRR